MAVNQKTQELSIVHDEISSPTYAPDLAARVKYIFENKLPYGIYHGANDSACTWYEFAKEFFRLQNIPIIVSPVLASGYNRPAARPHYSVLLNTKLPPARSWQEALRDFLQK